MYEFTEDIELQTLWCNSYHTRKNITDIPPSGSLIVELENELGGCLPVSYIAFMNHHSGGTPHKSAFPKNEATSWAESHAAINSFLSIGRVNCDSLCSEHGGRLLIERWYYPDIGVYICECPSAGHDMIVLDYKTCGPQSEPQVVHSDRKNNYRITLLAKDVEAFARGLVDSKVLNTDEEDYQTDLQKVTQGRFSELLAPLVNSFSPFPRIGEAIRATALKLLEEKRYFALHDDPLSYLLYDIQFWVYQHHHRIKCRKDYLDIHGAMIALGGVDLAPKAIHPASSRTGSTIGLKSVI